MARFRMAPRLIDIMNRAATLYNRYYDQHGTSRNDLLSNPEVMFQTFAFDRANIRALQRMDLDRDSTRILDVGCGSGASLLQFLRLGFRAGQMAGVDNSEERIDQARAALPNVEFRCESADELSFGDCTVDLVFESTMFCTLDSEQLVQRIAREMVRITTRGGYLMLADWRYARRGSGASRALSMKRIAALFDVGVRTELVGMERGALVPPLGRLLSKRAPALYFLTQAMIPLAAGQITTILRKK